MKKIVIAHLYPRDMSIYGDIGNVIALRRRLEWRGYEPVLRNVDVGDRLDGEDVDIIFGGGGQDSGQKVVYSDLLEKGEVLRQLARDGVPMLTICGTYQLFGHGFTTVDADELPGIDIFKAVTRAGGRRMIGNIVVESPFGRLVGFENHSGQTELSADQLPLGRVLKGYGNNDSSGNEGAVLHNAIGTYMHGPLLPKNPKLADYLILAAVKRRYGVETIDPIDDSREWAAASVAASRPQ